MVERLLVAGIARFFSFFSPVLIFSRSHSRLPSRSKRRRRRPKERRRRQQERERQETHRTSFDPLQPLLLPLSAPRTEGNTPSEAQARTEESEQRRRASVAVFPSSLLRRNRPSQNSIKERVSKVSSSSFLFPFSAPLREQMDEARLRGLRVETQVQPGRTGTGRREKEERRKRRKISIITLGWLEQTSLEVTLTPACKDPSHIHRPVLS